MHEPFGIMTTERITFSFGKNWLSFARSMTDEAVDRARKDIETWLGPGRVAGKTVVDIGSGSGIHSWGFYRLGAKAIVSFDLDVHSVEATASLRQRAGNPTNWDVRQGSILDRDFVKKLGTYDIVYAWGALHHTGALWEALANSCHLVEPSGQLWTAIYAKGPRYRRDLRAKRAYNAAPSVGKRLILAGCIARLMGQRLLAGHDPLRWNELRERGMTPYHDVIDWLGGLPYEVAAVEEVTSLCRRHGLQPVRVQEATEGANHVFVFSRPSPASPVSQDGL